MTEQTLELSVRTPLTLTVGSTQISNEIVGDLSLAFANRPLCRFSLAIDERAMGVLLERFQDKIYRACRYRDHSGSKWREDILRFYEDSWPGLRIARTPSGPRIYADSKSKALTSEKKLWEALPLPAKNPAAPPLYVVCKDSGSVR